MMLLSPFGGTQRQGIVEPGKTARHQKLPCTPKRVVQREIARVEFRRSILRPVFVMDLPPRRLRLDLGIRQANTQDDAQVTSFDPVKRQAVAAQPRESRRLRKLRTSSELP